MAERSQVTQITQWGAESTAGTAVTATRQMQGVELDSHIQIHNDVLRPQGYKYETIQAPNREWIQVGLKGIPSFNELHTMLASIMVAGGPTVIMDGATNTGGLTWTFDSSSTGVDTTQTFTINQGSSVRAHQWNFGLIRELGIQIARTGVSLSGQMIGRRITDGVSLAGGTTQALLVPVLGSAVDVYMDTAFGNLGTTKMSTRLFSSHIVLNNRFGPVWTVDSTQPSYASIVETPATIQHTVMGEADSQFMAMLTNYRNNNTTVFVRLSCFGPTIYTGGVTVKYQFLFDHAAKVGAIEQFSDHEGVYAIGFRLDGVHDSGWGKAMHGQIVNTQTTLV